MARNISKEEKEQITKDIESNTMSYVELQKKYGCSPATIWRIIKAKGIDRGKGVRVWQERKEFNEQEDSHYRFKGRYSNSDNFILQAF